MATSKYDQNALHGGVAAVVQTDTDITLHIRKIWDEKKIDRNFSWNEFSLNQF